MRIQIRVRVPHNGFRFTAVFFFLIRNTDFHLIFIIKYFLFKFQTRVLLYKKQCCKKNPFRQLIGLLVVGGDQTFMNFSD